MWPRGNALNSLVPYSYIRHFEGMIIQDCVYLDTFAQKARILHRWQRLHLVLQPRSSARASITSSFAEAQDDPSR